MMKHLIEKIEQSQQGLDEDGGESVSQAVDGLKAGMHLLRERADYLWDILEKREGFDVRRRMGRLIENIKHTEESVYGFIDSVESGAPHEARIASTPNEKKAAASHR